MKIKFGGGLFGGGDDGALFEHLSLNMFTIAEKKFFLKPLIRGKDEAEIHIPAKNRS